MGGFFYLAYFCGGMKAQDIVSLFEAHRDAEIAEGMRWYMKYQFEFLGIKKPVRNAITKDVFRWAKTAHPDELLALAKDLWKLKEREYCYIAMDIMIKGKAWKSKKMLGVVEKLILDKSWWDTVDLMTTNLVGSYFKAWPETRDEWLEKWMHSGNMWLQRVCILFQLKYREDTDVELLFKYCRALKESHEFFIQKAIGWALREYSLTDPGIIQDFVEKTALRPLSKREALKHFKIKT